MATLGISISFKHNFSEAERQVGEIPDRLDRAMASGTEKATGYVEDAYKELIPKRTGRTAGTITSFVESRPDGATGYVGTNDQIAQFLEYGTKPHIIRARNARALRFEVGSQVVFAKYVNHPGTNPTESLARAGEMSVGRIEQAFTTQVGEVLR